MNYRIKEICKEKGIALGDLATMIGIARENLSKLINGKSMPSIDTFERIADALNVPFTELFERPKQNVITCPKCGTLLELREPATGEIKDHSSLVKPVSPAISKIEQAPEQPKQPDPEPNLQPKVEPPKRTFFPATNYDARPQFRVREGALIHFGGKQYTGANITDAIALELLRDNQARIKYFDIYPENWEELVK